MPRGSRSAGTLRSGPARARRRCRRRRAGDARRAGGSPPPAGRRPPRRGPRRRGAAKERACGASNFSIRACRFRPLPRQISSPTSGFRERKRAVTPFWGRGRPVASALRYSPEESKRMAAPETAGDRRKRALVIDDDASVRRALVEAVAMLGYEADAAANGPQGIALFVRSRYDVVLTDVMMPGMTGWQVLDTIRELNLRIPVILVTGAPVAADDHRLARPGVALVRKPVDAGVLDAAPARLLPP